jgi:protein-tyrosine-phosphatase
VIPDVVSYESSQRKLGSRDGWAPAFAGATKRLFLCCAILAVQSVGLGSIVLAQTAAQTVAAPVSLVNGAAPAGSAAGIPASPWTAFANSFSADKLFYGVDLRRPRNLSAFARVLERSPLEPGELQAQAKEPEALSPLLRSVIAWEAASLIEDVLARSSGAPLSEGERAELAAQADELLVLQSVFDAEVRTKLQAAAECLHKAALPKAEALKSFQQAGKLNKPDVEDESSAGQQPGRGRLKADRSTPAPADEAQAASVPSPSSDLSADPELRELLAQLAVWHDDAEKSEAALKGLSKLEWTPERRARLRSPEYGLRQWFWQAGWSGSDNFTLAKFITAEQLGFEDDWELLDWLYPDYHKEIEDFYSHLRPVGKNDKKVTVFFPGSIFSSPKLLSAWVENVRRLKALSPALYESWRQRRRQYASLTSAHFAFPVAPHPITAKEGDYRLPYPLGPEAAPAAAGAQRTSEPALIDVYENVFSASESAQIRERYDIFDRLINANFQTLQALSSQAGALTRQAANELLAQVERMSKLYDKLEGGPNTARKAQAHLARSMKRNWRDIGEDEELPARMQRRISKLDPRRPMDTLHSLINWIHQGALSLFKPTEIQSMDASGGTLVEFGPSVRFLYLGDSSFHEGMGRNRLIRSLLRASPQAKADEPESQGRARRIKKLDQDSIFFDDNRLWVHAALGIHSAEIFADASDPDEGGMFRIRYQESGYDGSPQRMQMIAAFLAKFGMSVTVENQTYLNAIWDKDHGLKSSEQLAQSYAFILRFLHDTLDMDMMFGKAAENHGKAGSRDMADKLAEIYFGEGYWPLNVQWGHKKFQEYLALEPMRKVAAGKLDAELERLGLPLIPADVPFGARTIERFFTKPIQLAAARGELDWDGVSAPNRNKDYAPLDALARAVLADPKGSAQAALVLADVESSAFSYAPIGRLGALSAELAQKLLGDGDILTVHALRETNSGRLAYAQASLWRQGKGRLWFDLADVLRSNGYEPRSKEEENAAWFRDRGFKVASEEQSLSPAQEARLQELLRSSVSNRLTEQAEAYGLPASPGKGEFVTGPITFKRVMLEEGSVLSVPYTSPDDLEAISQAAAVLTTGGGSLSHAAITTRELGLPSVILSSARWGKRTVPGNWFSNLFKGPSERVEPMLELRLSRWEAPRDLKDIEAVPLAVQDDPNLHEGDLVRVYGKTGKVALIARAEDSELQSAYNALENLRKGKTKTLKWDSGWSERAERFLLEEAIQNARYSEHRHSIFAVLDRNVQHIDFSLARHSEPEPTFPELSMPLDREALWSRLEKKLSRAPQLPSDQNEGPDNTGSGQRLMALAQRMLRVFSAKPGGLDILFVGLYNTDRSPLAEQITRQVLRQEGIGRVRVSSRGLLSGSQGEGISLGSQEALRKLGFNPEEHQPAQLSEQDIRSADLILAPSESVEQWLIQAHPEAAPKLALLNRFAGLGNKSIQEPRLLDEGKSILEPTSLDEMSQQTQDDQAATTANSYEAVAKEILAAVQGLAQQVKSYLNVREIAGRAEDKKLQELRERKPSVLDLKDIDESFKPYVGGKSAKLGEMSQALDHQDAEVPGGVALTYWAYQRFLEENGLAERLRDWADNLDDHLENPKLGEGERRRGVSELSAIMRKIILSGRLNPEQGLGREIFTELKKRGLEKMWAVRSSAIQEDTDGAAFAGAAESYLNLRPEQVLDKVVENWASFWLERGILYRHQHGLKSADLLPATLIQEMAPAHISGVIFTRDPVTSGEEVVINAAYGLGEGVVSGQAAADVYKTRKWDGQETELPHVARKRWQVEPGPDGTGTRLGPVPMRLRGARALSLDETQRLTRIAVALEKRFGKPMDIEFSIIERGPIVILQARPITTP